MLSTAIPKYEQIPNAKEGNFLLFSMHSIAGIKGYLKKFPKEEKNEEGDFKGCSATLLWSGTTGNNTPLSVYNNQSMGFVLDTTLVDVPQADTLAYRSGSMLKPEVLKIGAVEDRAEAGEVKLDSKYKDKKGYYRHGLGQKMFVTNLAKHEHIEGKKESIYHSQGSVNVFAKNIWRKFHKRGSNHLNEAIAFQRGKKNPIVGLFITKEPSAENAKQLHAILKKNSSLKLYFYNDTASEHIVRYMDRDAGLAYLKKPSNFAQAFLKAIPFKGFLPFPNLEQKAEEKIAVNHSNDMTGAITKAGSSMVVGGLAGYAIGSGWASVTTGAGTTAIYGISTTLFLTASTVAGAGIFLLLAYLINRWRTGRPGFFPSMPLSTQLISKDQQHLPNSIQGVIPMALKR